MLPIRIVFRRRILVALIVNRAKRIVVTVHEEHAVAPEGLIAAGSGVIAVFVEVGEDRDRRRRARREGRPAPELPAAREGEKESEEA